MPGAPRSVLAPSSDAKPLVASLLLVAMLVKSIVELLFGSKVFPTYATPVVNWSVLGRT